MLKKPSMSLAVILTCAVACAPAPGPAPGLPGRARQASVEQVAEARRVVEQRDRAIRGPEIEQAMVERQQIGDMLIEQATIRKAFSHLVINEVDYDNVGTDLAEYIEIARRRIAADAPLFASVEVA